MPWLNLRSVRYIEQWSKCESLLETGNGLIAFHLHARTLPPKGSTHPFSAVRKYSPFSPTHDGGCAS
jgi:hypothetical protein